MKKQPAIEIKDIHKEFVLPQHKNSSIKQTFVNIVRKNNKTVQKVLDGVSFDIQEGDFFGIVGRNGSGKSTLLKILAGVYTPTSGEININGKLTPFIELGVGFNPELSGRDNVFLNGALLGFTHEEMQSMYDEIVEFAELEPYMDQKLKNYSSGMQVRLAFSVAIKARNEIMIFDEVLAVGDEAFQRKCLDVFEKYKATKQTVVLVTHDMETVKRFCNRAVLIQDGKVVEDGNPVKVADAYSSLNQQTIDAESTKQQDKKESSIKTSVSDLDDSPRVSFAVGEPLRFNISWKGSDAEVVMVDLYKNNGELVSNFISKREGMESLPNTKKLSLEIQPTLAPGGYYIDVALWDYDMGKKIEIEYEAAKFSVTKDFSRVEYSFGGVTLVPRKWLEKKS